MKRNNKNTEPKNNFVVHGIADAYLTSSNPDIRHWVNYHTHGLADFGIIELSTVSPSTADIRPYKLINLLGNIMIAGNTFNTYTEYTIKDPNSNTIYRFFLLLTTCFEEPSMRIIIINTTIDDLINDPVYSLQFSNDFIECENLD